MLVAYQNTIFASEEYAYGKYRLAARGWQFGSTIRMIAPVLGGFWVSDCDKTYFVRAGETIEAYSLESKSNTPAHVYSLNHKLVDLSFMDIPGLSAVWSSDEGQCIGSQDGTLIIKTKSKLRYPKGTFGSTICFDKKIINSVY